MYKLILIQYWDMKTIFCAVCMAALRNLPSIDDAPAMPWNKRWRHVHDLYIYYIQYLTAGNQNMLVALNQI